MPQPYATQAEFEQYVDGWVTDSPAALAKLLELAARDIDFLLGPRVARSNGWLMGNPSGDNELVLDAGQRAALSRAVCAQAEYRFTMGGEFFTRPQPSSVSGPHFSMSYGKGGPPSRFSETAARELLAAGLLMATGRAR